MHQRAHVSAILMICIALFASSALAFPIATPGTEGLRVIVNTPGEVIATYRGNSANYSNDLYVGLSVAGTTTFVFNNHGSPVGSQANLGSFPVGTELVFRLYVRNTGRNYYSGPAERNPDGHAHARVQEEWQPGETLVSFEDLYGGPFHYNDLSFSFTNTASHVVVCDAGGPYFGSAGVPLQFDGSGSFTTTGSLVSWEWSFGDGSTGTGMSPIHVYPNDGFYPVELCVTDDSGTTECCNAAQEGAVSQRQHSWSSIKGNFR